MDIETMKHCNQGGEPLLGVGSGPPSAGVLAEGQSVWGAQVRRVQRGQGVQGPGMHGGLGSCCPKGYQSIQKREL